MSDSLSNFVTQLELGYRKAACQPENGLLLAVSGGADSVALLHGTLQIWPDLRKSLAVAHVNHGLRAEESNADAEFVQNLAKQHGVDFELKPSIPVL